MARKMRCEARAVVIIAEEVGTGAGESESVRVKERGREGRAPGG